MMNYPALLAFFCGFISLSLEIAWVRLYGFSMKSTPAAFGFVLMAYLFGIAIGAKLGGKACERYSDRAVLWQKAIMVIFVSGLITLLSPVLFAAIHSRGSHPFIDFFIIALVSAVIAYVFPIAHHLGANLAESEKGKKFATVYVSNVLGGAVGPLVTGYFFLHYLSIQQVFVLLTAGQLGFVLFYVAFKRPDYLSKTGIATGVVFLPMALLSFTQPHFIVDQASSVNKSAKHVVENRHGIITIYSPNSDVENSGDDDLVFGGNVYDGRTNLSVQNNSNGLERLLLLAALQPEPKKVLMVGLSIGSWLVVVNDFPQVEQVDVVEINSGYIDAIAHYPAQKKALRDQRVNLVVDDARKWLKAHPNNQYDLIVMNTTWHWRANSSFLLSRNYLSLVKAHMKEGAVLAFNATGSADALYTAAQVFEHAYRYGNFIYAADFDFRFRKDAPAARQIYKQLTIGGKPAFNQNDPLIEEYLSKSFVGVDLVQKYMQRPLEVITDENAIVEFKYGLPLHMVY